MCKKRGALEAGGARTHNLEPVKDVAKVDNTAEIPARKMRASASGPTSDKTVSTTATTERANEASGGLLGRQLPGPTASPTRLCVGPKALWRKTDIIPGLRVADTILVKFEDH